MHTVLAKLTCKLVVRDKGDHNARPYLHLGSEQPLHLYNIIYTFQLAPGHQYNILFLGKYTYYLTQQFVT